MSTFQLSGLPQAGFEPFFAMTDAELAGVGAMRLAADAPRGFPCRVSLVDAAPGEELILLPFEHQPEHTPFRASGPIFVRKQGKRRVCAPGEIPDYITSRLISARAYDASHLMQAADICEGRDAEQSITRMFADEAIAYIHLHFAPRGCFLCRVDRV
jgi:hypothetical protein